MKNASNDVEINPRVAELKLNVAELKQNVAENFNGTGSNSSGGLLFWTTVAAQPVSFAFGECPPPEEWMQPF